MDGVREMMFSDKFSQMKNIRVSSECLRINSPSVYQQFISRLKSRLEPIFPPQVSPGSKVESPHDPLGQENLKNSSDPDLQEIVESADDEFLAAAFSTIFQNLEKIVEVKATRSRELEAKLDPLVPLEAILADSLNLGIMKYYSSSCTALVNLFIKV